MKRKGSLPEVAASALRDHGTEERIDRIWRRLESDLSTSPARPRAVWWWAPATVLIIFGSGVFVGARWGRGELPPPVALGPEPGGMTDDQTPPALPTNTATPDREERDPQKQHRRAPVPVPTTDEPPIPEIVEPVAVAPSPAPQSMTPITPTWEMLLNEGSDPRAAYSRARKAIEGESGGWDGVIRGASPDQLLSLADIARATGLPARAQQALRRVVENFPGDPSAPLAAYTLGKELEKAGDKAGAARAFQISRALSPKGSLAEDALARQVEAAIEQGNVELARQLADEYAKDFPKKGRRLSELRAQIAKLTGEPTKAAAKPGAGATPSADDEGPSEEPEEPSSPPK